MNGMVGKGGEGVCWYFYEEKNFFVLLYNHFLQFKHLNIQILF